MAGWPTAPVIYEIDTWSWLHEQELRVGRRMTLADLSGEVWDSVVPDGVDAVWLMGVWERSPAGLAVARGNEELMRAFREVLPDLGDADVTGSPYCVRRYVVDEYLGGPAALEVARAHLARRGARLVLDFVPNHVAPDHPWVAEHPEFLLQGGPEDLERDPAAWTEIDGRVFARGRDPFFPPWADVLQVNAFAPGVRDATVESIAGVADQCDGVRCDMAMLLTGEVFTRSWAGHVGTPPEGEFWPEVIEGVRRTHPDLVFVAEVYWGLEELLQRQGFDFCYDKVLYDRLVSGGAEGVRDHLGADPDRQRALVRFIENHDEERAATQFPGDRGRCAAVTVATVPGATLWHEGQFEGRRIRLPVFLTRRPDEPADVVLSGFYRRLLSIVGGDDIRRGAWTLLDCQGWPDNPTFRDLVAWAWHGTVPRHVVVVNLSAHPAQGRVLLPWTGLGGRRWYLVDELSDTTYERDGDRLVEEGLYVDLPPWGFHLLFFDAEDPVLGEQVSTS